MSILSLKKFPTRILRAKYHLFSEACAIEDYINKKSDQKTLEHLKPQIVKEIKHEFTNNNNNDDNNKGFSDRSFMPTFKLFKVKFTFSEKNLKRNLFY